MTGQHQPGMWNIDQLLFSNWRRLIVILFCSVCLRSSITKDIEGKVMLDRVVADLLERHIYQFTMKKILKRQQMSTWKSSLRPYILKLSTFSYSFSKEMLLSFFFWIDYEYIWLDYSIQDISNDILITPALSTPVC